MLSKQFMIQMSKHLRMLFRYNVNKLRLIIPHNSSVQRLNNCISSEPSGTLRRSRRSDMQIQHVDSLILRFSLVAYLGYLLNFQR